MINKNPEVGDSVKIHDVIFNAKNVLVSQGFAEAISRPVVLTELKENYFALIKTIQENKVNNSTNNIADELGFIDEPSDNNNENINKMVDELLANVNRISFKLQSNA